MPPKIHVAPQAGADFGNAARILLNSAQKSGAVKLRDANKIEYAKELKKIQTQSKKKGGSLGGVSYRVADFLAASQRENPVARESKTKIRSTAVSIPILSIPSKVKQAEHTKLEKKEEKETARDDVSKPLPPNLLENEQLSKKEESQPLPFVDIAEDKPLFEKSSDSKEERRDFGIFEKQYESVILPAGVDSSVPSTTGQTVESTESTASIVGVASKEVFEEAGGAQEAMDVSISVDSWEQQREREIERLRLKQEDAERRKLAEIKAEQNRTLGQLWMEKRSRNAMPFLVDNRYENLSKIYFSTSPENSLRLLSKISDTIGARSGSLVTSAVLCVARQISLLDETNRMKSWATFAELMKSLKVSESVENSAKMMVFEDDAFENSFNQLSPSTQSKLDQSMVKKACVHFIRKGMWEEAISVIEKNKDHIPDLTGSLPLLLLKNCRSLDSAQMESVISYASRILNEKNRLGVEAKLALILCEKGASRKIKLAELADSSEANEAVYAELIKRSDRDEVPGILAKMENGGFDKNDPKILAARAFRSIDEHDPLAVFREIEQQAQSVGILAGHLSAAAKGAEINPSDEVLSLLVSLLKRATGLSAFKVLFRVLALLYDQKDYDHILELYEFFKSGEQKYFDYYPNSIAFVNAALINKGQPPLSDLTPNDIQYKSTLPGIATFSNAQAENSLDLKEQINSITEKMLAYAKERNWESALKILDSLGTAQGDNDASLTLIYNCALSAAVEKPIVALKAYELMKERNVSTNVTTVNTVLSSLSRAGMWEESLSFFETIKSAERDVNTYLVFFSLLNKQNLWQNAFSTYEEMRKTINKPSATMFSLAIGSTCNHNWSVTLKMFNDMLKIHGNSVKENIVQQVVRCLEQNNRTAELATLEKELKKKKKKK